MAAKKRKTAKKSKSSSKRSSAGKKKSYASAEFSRFLHSFSRLKSLKALLVASFDIMFYILAIALSFIMSFTLEKIIDPLRYMDPSALTTGAVAQASAMNAGISRAINLVIAAAVIYVILLIAGFALSKYMIWTTLVEKGMAVKDFLRFFLLNIVWAIPVIAVGALIFVSSGVLKIPQLVMAYSVIMILLYVIALFYFTYLIYYSFMKKERVFSSIKNAFVEGVKKLNVLWLPLLLVAAVFMVAWAVSLLSFLLPTIISSVLNSVLLIALLTWAKLYAASVFKKHVKA